MSRIGQQPIEIPQGVSVTTEGRAVKAKGALGELALELPEGITAEVKDGKVLVNMGPAQSSMTWESALEETGNIDLIAPDVTGWVEAWRAEVRAFCRATRFDGLEILEAADDVVRFHAELTREDRDASFVERSVFAVHDGRWKYVSGTPG